MSRWILNLELNEAPLCPKCMAPLMNDVCEFWHGIAFCSICFKTASRAELILIDKMMDGSEDARHLSEHHGLFFWTPRGPVSPKVSPLITRSFDPTVTEPPLIDCTPRY